jgi:hypothetical protein
MGINRGIGGKIKFSLKKNTIHQKIGVSLPKQEIEPEQLWFLILVNEISMASSVSINYVLSEGKHLSNIAYEVRNCLLHSGKVIIL